MLKVTFKKIIIMASCCYSHIPKADLVTELSKVFFPDMSSGEYGFMLSLDLTLQSAGLCMHTIFSPLLGGKKFFSPFNVSRAILAGFVPILGSSICWRKQAWLSQSWL